MRMVGTSLIPQRRRPGTFALLIAATCLLMLLAAALTLALQGAAHELAGSAADRVLVQVVDANPIRRDATTDEILARLDRLAGFGSAHRVPPEEVKALVAPYIAGVSMDDLPLPAMIELDHGDSAALSRAFKDLPNVQVTAAGAELSPLVQLVGALRGVSLGIVLTAAAATALIAMLAARSALAREGPTLGILHALGATDGQVSRLVTGKIARDAALGAGGGLVAGAIIILAIASRLAALGAGIDAHLTLGAWSILILLPMALVLLATGTAQATLLLTLRRTP